MRISDDEVRQTALLARLHLDDDEVAQMARELDAILGYMDQLAALDVTGIEPMTHADPTVVAPLRSDELGPQLPVEAAMADAPRREGAFFEVPKIIDVSE